MDSNGIDKRFNNKLRNNDRRNNTNNIIATDNNRCKKKLFVIEELMSLHNMESYIDGQIASCLTFGAFDCWSSNSDQVEEIKRRKEYLYDTKKVKEKNKTR